MDQRTDAAADTRAALYSDSVGPSILSCGREALRMGERVVSASTERRIRKRTRHALHLLVDRMLDGEFDVIIAALGPTAAAGGDLPLVRLTRSAVTPSGATLPHILAARDASYANAT